MILEGIHVHYTYFIIIEFVDCVYVWEIEIPENVNQIEIYITRCTEHT